MVSFCCFKKGLRLKNKIRDSMRWAMDRDAAISDHLDLTSGDRQGVADGLFSLLSTTVDLYHRTQVAHWNIRGMSFVGLHELFQQQYEELSDAIDEIAERIRALGFFVDGSLAEFSASSLLSKANFNKYAAEDCLRELVASNAATGRTARQVYIEANASNDGASADLLGRRLIAHEKAIWMLSSHL